MRNFMLGIVVLGMMLTGVVGLAVAFDTPTSFKFYERAPRYNVQVQFGLLNAIGNTVSYDLEGMFGIFSCSFTRMGSTDVVLHLQAVKPDANIFAFTNITGASGHTVDATDSDSYAFMVVNHDAQYIRLRVASGADATHAITNAVCTARR